MKINTLTFEKSRQPTRPRDMKQPFHTFRAISFSAILLYAGPAKGQFVDIGANGFIDTQVRILPTATFGPAISDNDLIPIETFGDFSTTSSSRDLGASGEASIRLDATSSSILLSGNLRAQSGPAFDGDARSAVSSSASTSQRISLEVPPGEQAFSVRWQWDAVVLTDTPDSSGIGSFFFRFARDISDGFSPIGTQQLGDGTESSSGSGYFEGSFLPTQRSGDDLQRFDLVLGSTVFVSTLGPQSSADVEYSVDFLVGPGATSETSILPTSLGFSERISLPPALSPSTPATLNPTEPFVFEDVPSGRWFDPVAADGFHYVIEGDSLFTRIIDFADGFDQPFRVFAEGEDLGLFGENDSIDFADLLGRGVTSFTVLGITPLVDGGDPLAFPIQLAFNTEVATFAQFAVTAVPEPASISVIAAGLLLARTRRRPVG